jgi:hypothetical protein
LVRGKQLRCSPRWDTELRAPEIAISGTLRGREAALSRGRSSFRSG